MKGRDLAILGAFIGAAYLVMKARTAHAAPVAGASSDGSTTVTYGGVTLTLPFGLSADDPLVQQILNQSPAPGSTISTTVGPVTVQSHGGGASW